MLSRGKDKIFWKICQQIVEILEKIPPAADSKPVAAGRTPEINSRQRARGAHFDRSIG